ncbi:CPBP family intramembrane glutamic endopeptidase [Streptosporangium sp. NPDC051023]|uniref:CPBP family intramembrane glutamic endopeptidase n=1 Tax=Streptosporangium sp. NPDC051023 TaxID=3155410 RepID=UPI0034501236
MSTMSATHRPGGGRLGRFAGHPLVWMPTGLVGVILVSALTATAPGPLPLVGAAAAVAVYWLVMRYLARRPTPEIARRRAVREALAGGAVGLGFMLVSVLLITALGGYSFSWAGRGLFSVVVSAVIVMAGTAVTEELMFRGLALQAVERLGGSLVALAVTAGFFGVAHLFNPGASVWSSLAIAIEAGVLLGAAFLWRRNLWFVSGLHFAWNTVQQLLGIPTSGHAVEGLLTVRATGPAVLTGGSFGLEASIIPVVVGLALAIPMLILAHRRGGLVRRPRATG